MYFPFLPSIRRQRLNVEPHFPLPLFSRLHSLSRDFFFFLSLFLSANLHYSNRFAFSVPVASLRSTSCSSYSTILTDALRYSSAILLATSTFFLKIETQKQLCQFEIHFFYSYSMKRINCRRWIVTWTCSLNNLTSNFYFFSTFCMLMLQFIHDAFVIYRFQLQRLINCVNLLEISYCVNILIIVKQFYKWLYKYFDIGVKKQSTEIR